MATGRQAITWTNDDKVIRRHMVSLRHNEIIIWSNASYPLHIHGYLKLFVQTGTSKQGTIMSYDMSWVELKLWFVVLYYIIRYIAPFLGTQWSSNCGIKGKNWVSLKVYWKLYFTDLSVSHLHIPSNIWLITGLALLYLSILYVYCKNEITVFQSYIMTLFDISPAELKTYEMFNESDLGNFDVHDIVNLKWCECSQIFTTSISMVPDVQRFIRHLWWQKAPWNEGYNVGQWWA